MSTFMWYPFRKKKAWDKFCEDIKPFIYSTPASVEIHQGSSVVVTYYLNAKGIKKYGREQI